MRSVSLNFSGSKDKVYFTFYCSHFVLYFSLADLLSLFRNKKVKLSLITVKELTLCHKLKLSNRYIFETLRCKFLKWKHSLFNLTDAKIKRLENLLWQSLNSIIVRLWNLYMFSTITSLLTNYWDDFLNFNLTYLLFFPLIYNVKHLQMDITDT